MYSRTFSWYSFGDVFNAKLRRSKHDNIKETRYKEKIVLIFLNLIIIQKWKSYIDHSHFVCSHKLSTAQRAVRSTTWRGVCLNGQRGRRMRRSWIACNEKPTKIRSNRTAKNILSVLLVLKFPRFGNRIDGIRPFEPYSIEIKNTKNKKNTIVLLRNFLIVERGQRR